MVHIQPAFCFGRNCVPRRHLRVFPGRFNRFRFDFSSFFPVKGPTQPQRQPDRIRRIFGQIRPPIDIIGPGGTGPILGTSTPNRIITGPTFTAELRPNVSEVGSNFRAGFSRPTTTVIGSNMQANVTSGGSGGGGGSSGGSGGGGNR